MDTDQRHKRVARYERFLDDPFLLALRGVANYIRARRMRMAEAAMLNEHAGRLEGRMAASPELLSILHDTASLVKANVALTSEAYRIGLEHQKQILGRAPYVRNPYVIATFAEQERPRLEQELANLKAGDE